MDQGKGSNISRTVELKWLTNSWKSDIGASERILIEAQIIISDTKRAKKGETKYDTNIHTSLREGMDNIRNTKENESTKT